MEHAQRGLTAFLTRYAGEVLILILMEHAQRELYQLVDRASLSSSVLILILMEHVQRVGAKLTINRELKAVLILILMEHAQRVRFRRCTKFCTLRLNPYFNGTCSKRTK